MRRARGSHRGLRPVPGRPVVVLGPSPGGVPGAGDGVETVDAPGVQGGRAALDAVNDVALLEQKISKVCAVLSGDTCNEGDFL